MFVYGHTPEVAVQTTSATPLTETAGLWFSQAQDPGKRALRIMALYIHGRGAGLTAITGLVFRVRRSTGGVSGGDVVFANPRHVGAPASNWSAIEDSSVPTLSGGPLLSIGCGAAGASGWFSQSRSSDITKELNDGTLDGMVVLVASGLASMNYNETVETIE